MATIKISDNNLDRFYSQNSDFDILKFNFSDRAELSQLHWQGLEQEQVTILELLKKYQRLLRLHPEPSVATALLNSPLPQSVEPAPTSGEALTATLAVSATQPKRSLDSAHAIAAIPQAQFVRDYGATVGGEAVAKEIHQNATAVKAKTTLLWANVHNTVASPHFRAMLTNNVGDDIHQFENFPDYQEVFGSLNYYECEHCHSIFSPAAYFVDLMRITEASITTKNNIDSKSTLKFRRPDLAQIPLTCEQTNDLVPYLDIVNKVVALQVDGLKDNPSLPTTPEDQKTTPEDQKIDGAYKFLATATYPFNLPFNLPLEQIRSYLGQQKTDLASIYKTFNVSEGAIAREILGLSIEECNLITTPKPTETDLLSVYGIAVAGINLGGLINLDTFLHQTGLSRQELHDLLYQNLSQKELNSGLAHHFYINQVLESQYLQIVSNQKAPDTIQNLNLATLDRINRFVRLAKKLNWSFADLDWVLTSIGVTGTKDIDLDAIQKIAKIAQLQAKLNLPLDVLCSFWHDIKTIGVGDAETSQARFDLIFNNAELLNGKPPYHPAYSGNSLYTCTALTLPTENSGNTDNAPIALTPPHIKSKIAAGLRISLDDLTALVEAFWGTDKNLTVENLSVLYRHTILASLLRLPIDQYLIFLHLIGKKLSIFSIDDLDYVLESALWLGNLGCNVYELDYILNGIESKFVDKKYKGEDIQPFLKTLWALSLSPQPEIKVSDITDWTGFVTKLNPPPGQSTRTGLITLSQDIQTALALTLHSAQTETSNTSLSETQKCTIIQDLNDFCKRPDFYQTPGLSTVAEEAQKLLTSKEVLSQNEIQKLNRLLLEASYPEIAKSNISKIGDEWKEKLIEQLATFLGSTTDIIKALLDLIPKLTPFLPIQVSNRVHSYIDIFLTPDPSNRNFEYIEQVISALSRGLVLNQKLQFTQTEIASVLSHPTCYGIASDFQNLSIDNIKSLYTFKQLTKACNDTQDELIQYFAEFSSLADSENKTKATQLEKITGWKQEQIEELATTNFMGVANLYNSVEGIAKLKNAFDLSKSLGADISFYRQIKALATMSAADNDNWKAYNETAQSIAQIVKAKYSDDDWAKVSDKLNSTLNELKRNALTGYALWKLNQEDHSFKTLRNLSEYLLIDVETTGCATISYIKQAILSLQMYMQRCRLNVEPGVLNVNIPEVWWEWMLNYRIWEANRKVFLYPENYIEPNLRKSKSDLFKELESELMQSDITQESVEAAYYNYFDKLAELAKLRIAATYRCFVQQPDSSKLDTLFIFGRTATEPYTYYYRECLNPTNNPPTWNPWSKIDIHINSDYISPAFAFNKLFVFWVEITENKTSTLMNGMTEKTTIQKATIKFTFQTVSKKWVQPQTLSKDIVVSTTTGDRSTSTTDLDAFLKKVYPLTIPGQGTESEKFLVLFADIPKPPTLTSDLLIESQTLSGRMPKPLDNYLGDFCSSHPPVIANRPSDKNLPLPVANWPMNEMSGETVHATNTDFNGTLLNVDKSHNNWELAEDFPGGYRYVLQLNFHSDTTYSFVNLPVMDFDYSQGFTIEAWVCFKKYYRGSRIIDFSDNKAQNGIIFASDYEDGKTLLFGRIRTPEVSPANTWMHLVATVDASGTGKIYRDGELIKVGQMDVPKNILRNSCYFGKSSQDDGKSNPDAYFSGRMAGIRIWNVGLTSDQILSSIFHCPPLLTTEVSQNNSFTLTVKNQPGWFTFDNGDEAFLVMPQAEKLKPISDSLVVETDSNGAITLSYTDNPPSNSEKYTFTRLTTSTVRHLSQKAFIGGIDHLLTPDSQLTPELNFARFNPSNLVIPPTSKALDFNGSYGLYFQEIFFHIPFLVANTLNANQRFAEAQKWYHYIFNPTQQIQPNSQSWNSDRFWRYLPFRGNTLKKLEAILTDDKAIAAYNNDPFDPHAIAQLRIGAYEKAIVMKYIDNLLDWGDNLFAQDTWESITQATLLYLLAYDLLGAKPEDLGKEKSPQPETFQCIQTQYKDKIPQFLIELEQLVGTGQSSSLTNTPFNDINAYFCVSENEQFTAYWDRVEDRLYKIRHCQNIEGVMRQLALFEPAIDPNQLVRAVASGNLPMSVVSGLRAEVPNYRFDYMLERAKNITSTVIQLGSSLLSALEKKDAEQISLLKATQESAILRLIQMTKEKQITEAQANVDSLNKSLDAAQNRLNHYQNLIDGKWNAAEIASVALAGDAILTEVAATVSNTLAAPAYLTPDIYGLADGGMNFGAAVATIGASLSGTANTLNQGSSLAGAIAQYQRRAEDWQLQLQMAQDDVALITQQITASQINLDIATAELNAHLKSIEQANEVENFFQNKFSNQDLYQWMVSRLAILYFQTFKIALDMALAAQKAYQYELNQDDTYISFDYWDSLKKGLLAGEGLMLGLNQLEKAYIEGNFRTLEIEKTISLSELDKINKKHALNALKTNGTCTIDLSEKLFDLDFPGHYCRQIKTISISIPAVIGPYQNIKATLTQLSDKTLIKPDVGAVEYLLGNSSTQPDTSILRSSWRRNQKIALSRGVNDSGLFELNFRDERYLPFEGTGAVSTWELSLPKETNKQIDFDNLTDVIINLSYTALDAGEGEFKEAVHSIVFSQKTTKIQQKV
ncbi:neuraminidase-like domain-containing protein [Pseudanabaena sp. PCC 6802]|uniref:Tc toxin subunit A-related protein n=1 Tax=Pseudanabaena sp. PCC 6802 TaxID=118173 RepID=UPI00034C23D7|nr:neuraminidase-like domain-containing protein [Pseudanabaena sp. PCC 6802]